VIKIHVYIIICICCVDDNTHVKKWKKLQHTNTTLCQW
jgi:hypothetical protein